jgi:hypothetical protein
LRSDRYPVRTLGLVATPDAPRLARQFVYDVVSDWGVDLRDRGQQSRGDEVAQAIIFAEQPTVTVTVRRLPTGEARVEVRDQSRRIIDLDAEHTPAARAVAHGVADDWNIDRIKDDGLTMWIDLRIAEDPPVG